MKKLVLSALLVLASCSSSNGGHSEFSSAPPELFDDSNGACHGKNKLYLAELNLAKAHESAERFVFQPEAGGEAVKGFLDASQCFQEIRRDKESLAALKLANELAGQIQADYRKTWLRAQYYLRIGSSKTALADFKRTRSFLSNHSNNPFMGELEEKISKLSREVDDNVL